MSMDLDILEDNKVLLLDGGFSNELEKFVTFDVHKEPLWTAKALHCDEQSIVKTHLKYLEAGADIVETSTYQATVVGFRKYLSLDETLAENLMMKSVTLANTAVKEFLQSANVQDRVHPLVIGSIGPYGAHLCDGSEYRGTYIDTVESEKIIELHLPRIRALIKGGVNLLAIETMPSVKEVEILLELLKKEFPETKAMVSFSVKEKDSSFTAYGNSITEAFQTVAKYPQVWGFGINCCAPTIVSSFLTEISKFRENADVGKSIRLVVYPNTGQDWIAGKGWIKDPVPTLDTYVQEWMKLGATVIGGCCQVGADEIKMMRPLVDAWNSELKIKG